MFQNIETRFNIEQIGYAFDRIFSSSFEFKGESHDFIEMVYVYSGNIQVTEDEKIYNMCNGDIIFHAPMEFHCIKSHADTSPHVKNLSIKLSGSLPKQIFDGVFHLNTEQHMLFMKYFDIAKSFLENQNHNINVSQQISCGLSALLLDICEASPLNTVVSTDNNALLYKQIVNTMQETVYKNFSLCELASINHISVSYVKKLFTCYANTSPKRFYNSLRAKEAAYLIKTGASSATIAEKMQFSSPNYFTLFFKKHLGCTPSEYKRK